MNSALGDIIPGLRLRSEVIGHYPWRTMMVQDRVDIVDQLGQLSEWQSFATTTSRIERYNLTDGNRKCEQIRLALKYKPLSPSVPATGYASKESYADAARYLTRLRLADIILLLDGYPESPNSGKREVVVSSPWNAGEVLASVKKLLKPFRTAGPMLKIEASAINEGDGLVTKHLKKLVKYSTLSALTTIQVNIIMVALQVSFFSSGDDDYEAFLARHKRGLSASEISLLNTILGRDLYLLRRPLYMSCHLTVLLAISAHPLTKQGKYQEVDIINDASSIGRPKADVIARTEKMVWKCIFDIAFGRDTLENALQVLHNKIPFEEIDALHLVEDGALRITATGPASGTYETQESDSNNHVVLSSTQHLSQGSTTSLEEPISLVDITRHSESSHMGEDQGIAKVSMSEPHKDSEGEEEMEVEQETPQDQMEDEDMPYTEGGNAGDFPIAPGAFVPVTMDCGSERVTDDKGSSDGDRDDEDNTNAEGTNIDQESNAETRPSLKKRKTILSEDEDFVMGKVNVAQNWQEQRPTNSVLGKRGLPEAEASTSSLTRASLRLKQKIGVSFENPNLKSIVAASPGRQSSRHTPVKKPNTLAITKTSIINKQRNLPEPSRHRAFTPFVDLIYGDEDEDDNTSLDNVLVREPMRPELATEHVIKNVQLWDAFGKMREIKTMFFTDPDEKAFFEDLLTAAQHSYEDGKPLHVSQPSKSIYHILDAEAFEKTLPRDRQVMFGKRNIVLKNFPTPAMSFDRKGLGQITHLYLPQTICDLTLPKGRRDTIGTADDVIQNAKFDQPKPMNSLDNPMPDGPQDGAAALATDLVAFKSVNFIPEGSGNVQDASKDRKWGLFATEGAITLSHVDAEGLATAIDVLIGGKAWVTIRPEGSFDPCDFADPRQFRRPFELDFGRYVDWCRIHGGIPKNFVVEIILLTPGTRHLMQPNCLHAAYTFGNTVCHGSHFYAISTLRRTFCGLVFTLVQEKFLTNTNHPPMRLMIRRIVQYVHMNIIHGYHQDDDTHCFDSGNITMESFTELFSVIALGILSTIVDPRTYCFDPDAEDDEKLSARQRSLVELYDCNSLPESERVGAIYTRGLAYELLEWFTSRYDLHSVDNNHAQEPTSDRIHAALAHEAFGIYVARDRMDREGLWAPNVSLEAIRRQLSGLAPPGSIMHQSIIQLLDDHDGKLTQEDFNLLYDWKSFKITARASPSSDYSGPWSREKLFTTGQTQLDAKNVQWLNSEITLNPDTSTPPPRKSYLASLTGKQLRSRTPK